MNGLKGLPSGQVGWHTQKRKISKTYFCYHVVVPELFYLRKAWNAFPILTDGLQVFNVCLSTDFKESLLAKLVNSMKCEKNE